MAPSSRDRLYRINLPTPNPGLARWLTSSAALGLVEEHTARIYHTYEALLPVRTTNLGRSPAPGHLKRSAYYYVARGGWGKAEKDRWFGYIGNSAEYAGIIEFGSAKRGIAGRHDLARALGIESKVPTSPFKSPGNIAKAARAHDQEVQAFRKRTGRDPLTVKEKRDIATDNRRSKFNEAKVHEQKAKREERLQAKVARSREREAAKLDRQRRAEQSRRDAEQKRNKQLSNIADKKQDQKRRRELHTQMRVAEKLKGNRGPNYPHRNENPDRTPRKRFERPSPGEAPVEVKNFGRYKNLDKEEKKKRREARHPEGKATRKRRKSEKDSKTAGREARMGLRTTEKEFEGVPREHLDAAHERLRRERNLPHDQRTERPTRAELELLHRYQQDKRDRAKEKREQEGN